MSNCTVHHLFGYHYYLFFFFFINNYLYQPTNSTVDCPPHCTGGGREGDVVINCQLEDSDNRSFLLWGLTFWVEMLGVIKTLRIISKLQISFACWLNDLLSDGQLGCSALSTLTKRNVMLPSFFLLPSQFKAEFWMKRKKKFLIKHKKQISTESVAFLSISTGEVKL